MISYETQFYGSLRDNGEWKVPEEIINRNKSKFMVNAAQGESSMSMVVEWCTKDGVVFASDSRSSRNINGIPALAEDDVQKLFKMKNFILAMWDSNEYSDSGIIRPISNLINSLGNGFTGTGHEFVMLFANELRKKSFANAGKYSLLVGDKDSNGYKMDEYIVENRAATFISRKFELSFCVYANHGYVPHYIRLDKANGINEMEETCKMIVQSVVDYGKSLELNGLIDEFHIGGKVKTVKFTS